MSIDVPMNHDQTLQRVTAALLATQRHSWEQGIAIQALDAIGRSDLMLALVRYAVTAARPGDGRVGALSDDQGATDACSCGIGLRRAWELTGDDRYRVALDGLLDWALNGAPRNAAGVVYHEIDRPRFWVDSFFMLPPFLADAGYIDLAHRQIEGYWNALVDPATGLLFHIWDDERSEYDRALLWATGNGWALAGLAQVIRLTLPDRTEIRQDLVSKATGLIGAMIAYQRDDGLFHDILDQPETFVDGASALLAAYAIYLGLADGWLDPSYRAAADRMRLGATANIDQTGFVTSVCGAPNFETPGISAEAQAAFLLMSAAWQASKPE